MRASRVLGLVFVLALIVSACGDDDATTTTAATTTAASSLTRTPGVLTVGSDIPYPPFEDFDTASNVIGFDADLINEIATRLGLEVDWIDTAFDTIFTQLATGQFDVVASATTITPERALQVSFTEPYYNSQQGFTVNTTLTPFINGTEDLGTGDSVAVQTGTTGADWATTNLAPLGVLVREFDVVGDAYNAVEGGQVTGVVSDEPSAFVEIANREGLEIVEVIDTNEHYGFGVDPARTALLAQMNTALADMFADGTYQTIYDTWFEAPAGSVLFEEPAPAAIGTAENPIQVLFVPSVSAEEIIAGGELLAEALNTATGLFFEVQVPSSYAATIEAMCASPDNTIGFIPANAYVLANDLCGVTPALKSLRFGYTEYWAEVIVPRDSDIDSLDDLNGKTWAYPDATSTSGFLVPSGMFAALGITPGEGFEAGGHTGTVRAVYNNEAEFGTVFFSPNVDLEGNTAWDGTSEDADVPADLVETCAVTAEGDLVCDTVRPQDARRGLREEAPDVIQKVRILALSDPIPNDLMAYGPEFPADLQAEITQAIKDFATSDPDAFGTAFDAYSWDNVADTTDAEFDSIRALLIALGYDLEDL
ncbi:MAG TPA: phosphate/phosphite/phosphonate ABC transporter substrate-binding protein [Acidimicrobiia bacterium]|nr:phosphate/phosphite/phosphonate ABC transporter substrate-binding protein [Acidimicrobiia bacterium]